MLFDPATSRRLRRVLATSAIALAAALPAQVPEGLLPFRNPTKDVEVPRELFRDLLLMQATAQNPGDYEVVINHDGREHCTDPTWKKAHRSAMGKMFNMASMFGIVLRDSRHVNHRMLAAYGTFLVDDPQQVFQLIAFFPGEPVREIREAAFRRAIAFLRVHLPKNRPQPSDQEHLAPTALYQLEAGGFVGLLSVEDPLDQAQGLWFLAELCDIRPDSAPALLGASQEQLRELLVSDNPMVRKEARHFLHRADPQHRPMPAVDADDAALLAWLDAVLHDVFPPIRTVADGRTDLYPSKDLDRIIAVGREVLQQKSIGEPFQGRISAGLYYRGFRVARLPEPLDQLRIPVGAVITAINGQPVATAQSILDVLETVAKSQRMIMVEYVHAGGNHAMEYRLQQQ